MLGRADLVVKRRVDRLGELLTVGDQHAGGHGVVLGLADQVGRDERGISRAIGDDRDLGGPGLGIDADGALQIALGRGNIDVARAGDEVDRAALPRAVGEHRESLRATGGVDLVDPEQAAGRQDRGVRQSAELGVGRTGEGDARHARHLGWHGVHDDGADQRRQAARNVEADALHRDDAALDGGAGRNIGDEGVLELGLAGLAQPADGFLETGADVGRERVERSRDRVERDAELRRAYAVEAFACVEHGIGAPCLDVLTDRSDGGQRVLDIDLGARYGSAVDQLPFVGSGFESSQVKTSHHDAKSTDGLPWTGGRQQEAHRRNAGVRRAPPSQHPVHPACVRPRPPRRLVRHGSRARPWRRAGPGLQDADGRGRR